MDVPARITSGSRLIGAPDSRFMRPRCGLVEAKADWLNRPRMKTMSSRWGNMGWSAGPSSISAPLPFAHQCAGSTPFEKNTMPSRRGGPAAAPARRGGSGRRLPERGQRLHPGQGQGDSGAPQEEAAAGIGRVAALAHGLLPAFSVGASPATAVSAGARLPNCRLVTIRTARSAIEASPPAATISLISPRSVGCGLRPRA